MSSEDASRSAADTATTGTGAEPPPTAATPDTPKPYLVQRGPNAESAPDAEYANARSWTDEDGAPVAEQPSADEVADGDDSASTDGELAEGKPTAADGGTSASAGLDDESADTKSTAADGVPTNAKPTAADGDASAAAGLDGELAEGKPTAADGGTSASAGPDGESAAAKTAAADPGDSTPSTSAADPDGPSTESMAESADAKPAAAAISAEADQLPDSEPTDTKPVAATASAAAAETAVASSASKADSDATAAKTTPMAAVNPDDATDGPAMVTAIPAPAMTAAEQPPAAATSASVADPAEQSSADAATADPDAMATAATASASNAETVEPSAVVADGSDGPSDKPATTTVPADADTTTPAVAASTAEQPPTATVAATAEQPPADTAEQSSADAATADPDAMAATASAANAETVEQSPAEAATAEQPSASGVATTAEQPPADADSADPEVGRWRRFASTEPVAEPESGSWPKRALRRTGRALKGENAIAALVSLVLALAMNWRVLRDPMHTIPHDLGDPLQQTYTLAWPGNILLSDPAQLFNASIFYPNRLSFVFTDTLLGYAPASLIGSGTEAALLRYNIVYLFTFALAFFGMYVLLRQLGARIAGSAVGAAAVAYAPWKLAQEGHLNILSIGGIALALAMLARGHGYSLRDGYRPERVKWGWAIGGWLVAAWQVSLGFGIGVGFGYLLAGIVVVALFALGAKNIIASVNKRVGPRVPWRVLVSDLVGMLVFAGTSLVLAIPYFQVIKDHPEAERSLEEVDFFSPVWSSFLISPEESAVWGESHAAARDGMPWPPETTLLLGFTILALALVGLVWSTWTQRQRTFLALGVAFSVALALGTNFLDKGAWVYALAFEYLPGFNGLRTPGRLVLYTSILLAILAAGTLTRLADRLDEYAAMDRVDARFRARVPAPVRVALLLPLLLVLAEGYGAVDPKPVPEPPVAMSELADPVLVLPAGGGHDWSIQYWGVDGFPRMVNGSAAFTPSNQEEIRQHALTFPSAKSVADLRADGIKTVVAVRGMLEGSDWDYLLDIPGRDPSVTVEDRGSVLIFTL